MKLDSANKSFAAVLAVSALAGALAVCVGLGCVLIASLVARGADDGLFPLLSDPGAWLAVGFIAVVGAGVIAGVLSLRRQGRASRELGQRVRALELPLSPELNRAAARAGLAGRLSLVASAQRFSFAYGAIAPRVAISTGLLEAATATEVDAVLVHERYHVRNLDPLKVMATRALTKAFYYVPVLKDLERRYVTGRELAADRRAMARTGRDALASALNKVLGGPTWPELEAAAAIGTPGLLDARVSQLEEGVEPAFAGSLRRSLTWSLAAVLALALVFAAAVAELGGFSALGGGIGALEVVGALACALAWLVVGWVTLRWLGR